MPEQQRPKVTVFIKVRKTGELIRMPEGRLNQPTQVLPPSGTVIVTRNNGAKPGRVP